MAVSHVWSDGTGVGRKSPGTVNTCLFAFFAELAAQLDCTGIWWDTISLPTDQVARREAMSTMLWNYEYASVTVVHDEELTELEYKDDGSPAVALLLSPWFTRGWTAAELFASRGHPVKVLFKNPDPSGPPLVLKDLDTDILAFDTWSVFDLPDPLVVDHGPGVLRQSTTLGIFTDQVFRVNGAILNKTAGSVVYSEHVHWGPLEDRVFILAVAERQSREPPYGFVSCIWVACVRVAGFASEQVFWESSHNINACFGADNPSREQTMRYADIEFADGFIWAVKPGNDQKDEQKGSAAASPP
ncbi:hypothetical protein PRZ48_013096 [Zasmidium cellare]|uniref:Uncharacterized protein n=1 Tax=Zasmidium cellare TaxID=395010 RepID=A0ABR0E327_ZASCE|nr:hypothetical protein PRZ48_013096 [Zasmidium cellare]